MSRSSEARQMIDCALFCKAIDGYVDGELDPAHAIDMEGHVLACTPCADRVSLLRATRHSLRRVAAASAASAALRSRCGDALERERKRAAANREALVDADPKLIRLRYALGLAAAAGVVFAMGMARYRHNRFDAESARARAADGDAAVARVAEGSPAGFDTLLDDLVSLHAHPLPPETTNPDELAHWDPFVGVPVRRPAFQTFGGNFRGARVLANADRRAAMLQYTVLGGHRVTVYVFDPRTVPVQATRLEPRLVRERPVYVGHIRGYSVAAAERRGVGYALASDLDDDKSTDMVLAAMPQ